MERTIFEDMHIHSDFSDGRATVEQNILQAKSVGLRRICCVDHVRRDSSWIPEFVDAVERQRAQHPDMEISCGVEAKILDEHGTLDLPEMLCGIDLIYAADHQFPFGDRCLAPSEVRSMLCEGRVVPSELLSALENATSNAILRRPGLVLAHLFSILPKVGLSEELIPEASLQRLAQQAKSNGAVLELDERWRCPSLRTAAAFRAAGVPIICSTDSHRIESIGQYRFVLDVWNRIHAWRSR